MNAVLPAPARRGQFVILRAAATAIYCEKSQKAKTALDKAGKCFYTDAKLKKAKTCESEK
jgi:hypothetical protein